MRTFQFSRSVRARLCLLCVVWMEVGCQSLANRGVNFPSPPALAPSVKFQLGTSSFVPGGNIPKAFTCDGQNTSPALAWIGPPSRTQSFALILEDAEAARGRSIHWVVYDIPASATGVLAATPETGQLGGGARQGVNDFEKNGYSGPCPPPGATHHFIFKLYALDVTLKGKSQSTAEYIERAMKGHILAQAEITSTYAREAGAAQ